MRILGEPDIASSKHKEKRQTSLLFWDGWMDEFLFLGTICSFKSCSKKMALSYSWVATACYAEWGLIHVLAGSLTAYGVAGSGDVAGALGGICEKAPKEEQDDAKAVKRWNKLNVRILLQHGLNLLFVGFMSLGLAVHCQYGVTRASFALGLWPFMADVAYFIAIDTVHYGAAFAEMQTLIVSTALFATGMLVKDKFDVTQLESTAMLLLPLALIASAIINKCLAFTGKKTKDEKKKA